MSGSGELWPAAVVDDLVGGVFFPGDGTINPGSAALALARAAVDRGVRYVPGTAVTGFRSRTGRPSRDRASRRRAGDVEAEVVVLAAGLWTSELARLADASVALYPAEHVWVMTDETPGCDRGPAVPARPRRLPVRPPSRWPVRHRRVRAERQAVGAVRRADRRVRRARARTGTTSAPCWRRPAPGCRRSPTSGSGISCAAPKASRRMPTCSSGFVPEVPGLFVAAGLNSQGIIFGPGVGRAAAEWILAGHMTMDLVEVDVARMGRWASQRRWLHERTVESLGGLYAMHWPGKQPETARGLRRLPLDAAYRAAGAAMGQVGGWERPLWFEPEAGASGPTVRYSSTDPSWFPGRPRRGPGDTRGRRAVRPDDLREVRGGRAGRAGRPAAAGDVRPRRAAGPDRLHDPRRRAWRDPHGPDRSPDSPTTASSCWRRPSPSAGPRACSGRGLAERRRRDRRDLGVGRRSTWPGRDRASCSPA